MIFNYLLSVAYFSTTLLVTLIFAGSVLSADLFSFACGNLASTKTTA